MFKGISVTWLANLIPIMFSFVCLNALIACIYVKKIYAWKLSLLF